MGRQWGDAEKAWLRERYPKDHAKSLAAEFEREFGRKTTEGAIFQQAWKMGLCNAAREKEPQRAARKVCWRREPEMQAWMEANDRGQAVPLLSSEFEEAFGFPLSRPQIALWRANNGRTTKQSRGGRKPLPVGSERVVRGKYTLVKVAEKPTVPQSKDNWRMKHVLAYEAAHGPVPEGCDVVFANGDREDLGPENLVAVPHRLMSRVNSRDSPEWHDAEGLRRCMAWVELDMGLNAAEAALPRRCGVCGREFVPDAPEKTRQYRERRTCPECLAAGRKAPGERTLRKECEVCGAEYMARAKSQRRCPECIARELEFDSVDGLEGFLDSLALVGLIDQRSWHERGAVVSAGVGEQLAYKASRERCGKAGGRGNKKQTEKQ